MYTDMSILAFVFSAIGFLILTGLYICFERRQALKRDETQKISIFMYLQQFDVEDIDLRKSPPGGWHGTYMNKLAYGINKSARGNATPASPDGSHSSFENTESLSFTHSSTARDSTFMDVLSSSTQENSSSQYRDEPEPLLGYNEAQPYDDPQKYLKLKNIV